MSDDNKALTSAIGDLNDNHLLCRDLGHRWALRTHRTIQAITPDGDDVRVIERIVRCTVCHTSRTEQINRNDGELVRRGYKYTEGYRFPPGVAERGGMAKAPFRYEWVRRSGGDDADT